MTLADGCTATATITGSWSGGYQMEVAVKNTGRQVTASNQGHNGNLAAGASTTWGAVVNGTSLPVSSMACTGR